ncbi:MAG: DUF222 domain-containing protein [Acidimicrobiia bacterium]
MFDHQASVIGLWPGERPEDLAAEEDLVYELTCRELADGWVAEERHLLPDDLEDLRPGPYLAAILHTVDPALLNGHDTVRVMQARARLSSHNEAGKLRAMAEVAFAPPGNADSPVERDSTEFDFVAAEIAAGLTLTRRSAENEMERALSLNHRLHRVWAALWAGSIDFAKARVFENALRHLPDSTIDVVLDQILEDAESLTTGQLSASVNRLILAADPDGSASAFEEGLADRGVATYANPDQTGSFLVHNGGPADIAAARAHVEAIARSLKTADELRTLEEIRADVALDLLQGKCRHMREPKRGGRTNVLVHAETLLGLSDEPGELEGYGPVMAEIARKTARESVDGEWSFIVTDNGRPVATGTLSRRPTAAQKRHLEAVYPTCVFPGCRQPSFQCDLDHRRPRSQGGPTHNDNLGPLCRHHHMMRHHAPWQLTRLPDGDHQWTSPLGHTYIRKRGPPV